MKKGTYYLLMILATLLFAGAFIAGKLGASSFSPMVMTFLRIGLASLILFPVMIYKEGLKITKSDLQLSFVLGLVGMTFYHLFFFTALKYTTASNAAVINGTMPLITAIIAMLVLKEALSLRHLVFIFTAFIGVVTIITNWDFAFFQDFAFNKGDLFMLGGTVSWSIYGILIKKYSSNVSPLKLTAYTLLWCSLISMPFAVREIILYDSLKVPLESYYTILYMAVFPTVIGYTIQQSVIKHIGPSTASLFINLVPFFSIILSIIILSEPVNLLNMVSGLIIITSVILFARTPKGIRKIKNQ